MKTLPLALPRSVLLGTLLVFLTPGLFAANRYATPSGAGTQDGTGWTNAYPQAQIQTAVNTLTAGDTLYLGSGTYPSLSLALPGSGADGSPKSIIGVDTGGGLPLAQGAWDENTPGTTPGGSSYVFRFTNTVSYWVVKDFRVSRYAQAINSVSGGSYSNLTIDNVDADTVRDGIAMTNWLNCVVRNCDMIRHTKKGFRLASNVRFVTFENCTADGNGGNDAFPNEAYPTGFFSDSSSGNHDNTFIDCVARNQRMPGQPTTYWNGDGFSTESSNYNYTYVGCQAFDCHDGGFDDKAKSVVYDGSVALGNKRGFRYWGTGGLMVNCLSAYSQAWGDVMPAYALWASGSINVSQSTFFNATDVQVYADTNGEIVLNDSILSVDGGFANGAMTYGNVVLNQTVQYAPGAGPDANPNYIAPSASWTGSPANAFDSQTYTNPEKGYYQTGAANIPPLLTLTATPYTGGMTPLTVDFTATPVETDGMIVSYAWTFGDGGTSTAQNPSHTYTTVGTFSAQCTVTDNSGAIGVKQVSIQVIAPNAGPNHYITPAGAGSRNGSSWAHAYGEAELKALFNFIAAGHTVHLGSGTYTLGASIALTKSGTSSAPIVIQGVDTGSGLPFFDGTFNPQASNAGSGLFTFGTGQMSHLTIRNLRFQDQGWVFEMKETGTTDTLRDHITFENLWFDTIEDGIRLKNCNNIVVRNCHAIRYTKKAFRVSDYSSFVTVENCSADCTGGDQNFVAKAIPSSFMCDDTAGLPTIHDIAFIDCLGRNNGYPQDDDNYWNGDGFSSERGAYNISYIRCQSYNNNDGGFDDKANDLIYRDCVAAGNKKQYRIWAANVTLENCLGTNPAFGGATGGEGGTSGLQGLWLDDTARVTLRFATLHNGHIEVTSGGLLTIEDSILSKDSTATTFWTGSGVTLVRTETYSLATGTNPQYLAPDLAWRGSPANAYDSTLYGLTKGFNTGHIEGGDTTPPSVPAGLAANSIASDSFTLTWEPSTDNVNVTTYEVFRDGVSIATIFGTSLGLSDLSASTTYAMTVRARDAAGNWSAQSAALNVTTSASASSFDLILDNADAAGIAVTGAWTASTFTPGYYGANYLHDGDTGKGTKSVRFTPILPSAGNVNVYARWTAGTNRATNVPIDITHAGGTTTVTVDQQQNNGAWVALGTFAFNAGSGGNVLIRTTGTNGYVIADAVRFESASSPDTQAPSVPTGLAASNVTSSSFTLSWTASTDNVGVTGYEVFRNGVSIATPAGTSVSVTGLSASTTYAMTVRARDAAGNWSAQSAALNVTTGAPPDTTPPSVPAGLASSNVTSSSFTLSWNASADNVGVTGYEVFRDGVSIATPSGTSVGVTGLSPGTTYAMTVRARDAAGNWSAQSSTLNVTTEPPPDTEAPGVPAGLAATDLTPEGFTLTWNASTDNVGVTGYEVFLDGVSYATPAGTSAAISGLAPGTTYALTVRARDAAGNWSAKSTVLFVATPTGLSIGINLGDAANALAPGDIAGAVLASNWNNSTSNNETLANLLDSSGAATTAQVAFGNTAYAYANDTADPGGSLTDDAKLMRSQRAKSNASTMSAVVSTVPYATYDVYVYWGGRTAQETVPHTMAVNFQLWNGTAWVTQETKYIRDDDHAWDATYDESSATAAGTAVDGQEFVVFRGVAVPTFRIQVDTGVRTGLSGLQIVDQ